MNKNILLFVTFFIFIKTIIAKDILFIGATAHLGNGEKIENSIITIKEGKFNIVADATNIKINYEAFDTIIRVHGKHIYPAFISPNTTLGLTEIDAVRASKDFDEVGDFNPNIRSLIAYNTDSKILKTVRTNGVLITQATPRGGIISGSSSIMYLDGWNWEDATVKSDDGIHINWPKAYNTSGWWAQPGSTSENENYYKKINRIKDYFLISKSYYEGDNLIDIELESIKGLFTGEKNLYVHANYAKEIRQSIIYFNSIGIKNIIIVGGKECLQSIDILKKYNIPIILNRIHSLPSNEDASINEFYTLPSKLAQEGILFCFAYNGDMEAMGTRNLPFTAGTAVAYGLEYEKAISALSLNTCKIFGIDDLLGSIEAGKEATFFISDGDALNMIDNNIEQAYIKGKRINLDNHQKQLYQKYLNK